jgi:hypothetical protein
MLMATTTQPLAAAHTSNNVPSSLVSSALWVAAMPRRRHTRRATNKISCKVSLGNGGAGVVTIEPPEVRTLKKTVKTKAIVTVHLKDKDLFENVSHFFGLLGKLMHRKWLYIQLVSAELDPGEN